MWLIAFHTPGLSFALPKGGHSVDVHLTGLIHLTSLIHGAFQGNEIDGFERLPKRLLRKSVIQLPRRVWDATISQQACYSHARTINT